MHRDADNLLRPVLYVLRASIVLMVVGWILDVPGRLQIGLFTEQVLVAVLGVSLALTFLTFPLSFGETGEEAVAARVLEKKVAAVGLVDVLLAAARSHQLLLRRHPLSGR